MGQIQSTLHATKSKDSLIQVFGLGYVGFPLAVRLAHNGFSVIGVDTNKSKIQNLLNNSLDDTHKEIAHIYAESIKSQKFTPSILPQKKDTPSIGIISVPTPTPDVNPDSNVFVKAAVESFLGVSKPGDIIILESSVEVGTTEKIAKIIESAGYTLGENFGLCFCPERIDPLNKKWKLENIPRVIFATDDTTFEIAQQVYKYVNNGNLTRVKSPRIAEVVKSFENTFRMVNISLVNELAILCDKLEINVKDVIDAAATKPFGFMPFYSGAGVGGHCIPKDPQFLLESAKNFGLVFNSIQNAISINSQIPGYIADSISKSIEQHNLAKSVLVVGLAYKADIEDMRDSPGFKIATALAKKGFKVSAFDPYYKQELQKHYLVENHLKKLDFEIQDSLNPSGFSCLCLVQHHAKTALKIQEIYANSGVPIIYDCQNKLQVLPDSKSHLLGLGLQTKDWKKLVSKDLEI